MTTTASSIPATTINPETHETRFDLVLDLIANVTLSIQEKIDKTDWSDPDLADPIDTDCDPSIGVTFAIDQDFSHTLVFGDNSFSGPHNSFHHWGVSWISKDTDAADLAKEIIAAAVSEAFGELNPEPSQIQLDTDEKRLDANGEVLQSSRLILSIDDDDRRALAAHLLIDGEHPASYETALTELLFANSEYGWASAEETGDMTDAPMISIRDEIGEVAERWAFMDYQVVSFVEELIDYGSATFIS